MGAHRLQLRQKLVLALAFPAVAQTHAKKTPADSGKFAWENAIVQIEVAGKSVSDDELRKDLADKLRYDRMAYGLQVFNNLNIGVQNGYVTLTGQVRDSADRDSAESIVSNTPGVRGVHDEITVEKKF